jgi:hypothetical protein
VAVVFAEMAIACRGLPADFFAEIPNTLESLAGDSSLNSFASMVRCHRQHASEKPKVGRTAASGLNVDEEHGTPAGKVTTSTSSREKEISNAERNNQPA